MNLNPHITGYLVNITESHLNMGCRKGIPRSLTRSNLARGRLLIL